MNHSSVRHLPAFLLGALLLLLLIPASAMSASADAEQGGLDAREAGPDTYYITWYVEGNICYSYPKHGEIPEYPGDFPLVKEPSNGYTYRFVGWVLEGSDSVGVQPATSDAIYYAKFEEASRLTYTITWKNWDGTVLGTSEVMHGDFPIYEGEIPTRPSDGKIYEFDSWSPELEVALENRTYTATYTSYYSAGWHEINGKYYYYYQDGMCMPNGFSRVPYPDPDILPGYGPDAEDADVNVPGKPGNPDNYDYPDHTTALFLFQADGSLATDVSGTYTDPTTKEVRWMQNGMVVWHAGLIKDGNTYRYFKRSGMVTGCETYIAKTNGLLESGFYTFDENGVLLQWEGIHEDLNGNLCYYEGYRKVAAGLVSVNGSIYYVAPTMLVARGGVFYVSEKETNGLLSAGFYYFNQDGTMLRQADGLTDIGGNLYYMENYALVAKGLIRHDGKLYYIASDLKAVRNAPRYVSEAKANGLKSEGMYEFGADGALIERDGIVSVSTDDGTFLYYYENGTCLTDAGLLRLADGSYIYVRSDARLAVDTCYVSNTNGLLPSGFYLFGTDGKMIVKEGPVWEDGELFYYENGVRVAKGLVRIGENLYYFAGDLRAVRSASCYVFVDRANGLPVEGWCDFDEDGKLIPKNGVYRENFVDAEGALGYYVNSMRQSGLGLVRLENGDLIYVRPNGLLAVGLYYVSQTNGLLPSGFYFFSDDGTMAHLEGLVEQDGELYYYENDARVAKGLVLIGDSFYYFGNDLKAVRGELHYVFENRANGLKPEGWYQFDENGRLTARNGIFRETFGDGKEYLCYYVNDVRQSGLGLVRLEDGSLIYVRSGSTLAVGTYYVTKTNGILPEGTYFFDENGKLTDTP